MAQADARERQSELMRVLNLTGKVKDDRARVHKSRLETTPWAIRSRMENLTPENVKKQTSLTVSSFAEPVKMNKDDRARWIKLQEEESKMSRERFINSIGTKIFIKGRGRQGQRDAQAENQWNLVEAIRQGRVDMQDIGQSAGRPGYTYNSENTRDPGRGLPPDLATVLRFAQKEASVVNPRIRSFKRQAAHMQSYPYQPETHASVGSMAEGDITDKGVGYRTSDYQGDHYYPPAIPPQYTQTKVAQVNSARANYEANVRALDGTNAMNYRKRARFQT